MTDGTVEVSRRGLMTAAAGGAAAAAMAGSAAAQNGPDFEGWFDDVPNYDGVEDMTGQDTVTITVGAEPNNSWSFAPAAVRVDPGTEVVWEWSGDGGAHNVVGENADFESELVQEEGHTFSQTFDSEGIIKYFCRPHRAAGMKAAVVVGAAGGDGGGDGGGGTPDYEGWMDDVPNFESTEDLRGESSVTVTVGAEPNNAWSYAPPAIHVDPGTEVVWEWSGNGGAHNVVGENADFASELVQEEGHTFSQTFEEDGIVKYFCEPHRGAGMKGAVVVGSDYPSTGGGGDGGGGGGDGGGGGRSQIPESAMTLGVATSVVMTVTLGLAYVFIKYGSAGGSD